MTKEDEAKVSEMIEEKLMAEYRRGIAVGVKTACSVVADRLNDKTKSFMDRIKSVNDFCKAPFKLDMSTKKQEEPAENTPVEYADAIPEDTENMENPDE